MTEDKPFSVAKLAERFPRHDAGLYLTHNEHRDVYESVEQYHAGSDDKWVSEEQRQKAIAENNVWRLQWYPDTPIGFYELLACDLDVLLEAAKKVGND